MIHFKHNNQDVTLSNPRTEANFDDWPFGSQRVKCRFYTETHPKKGERICRVTENKTRDGWNKPKVMTYSRQQRICDGSDGRTYILTYDSVFGGITIYSSDMMMAANYYNSGSEVEIFSDLKKLFA